MDTKKKPKGRDLTAEEAAGNRLIGRKRVLVENIIGKLQEWKILKQKWRGKINNLQFYTSVFELCVNLPNLQRKIHLNEDRPIPELLTHN